MIPPDRNMYHDPHLWDTAKDKLADIPSGESPSSSEALLHELQVHQIELEMQNETMRQALIDLDESRDRYLDLYDFAPVGYLTVSEEGLITEANLTCARYLGIDRRDLLKRRFGQFVAPEDKDRCYIYLSNVLHRNETKHLELALTRASGIVFYAQLDCMPVKNGNGRALRISLTDITEHKHVEEVLRPSAIKHQLLFESSHDALMLLSPQTGKFIGANSATLQLFGIKSVVQFIEFGPEDLSPEKQADGCFSREKAHEVAALAMRQGSHSFEWLYLRQGKPFAADVLLTRMELGSDVFLQATVRDITERKKMEREVLESRQLMRQLAGKIEVLREEERKHIAREVHDELGQILTALRMDIALINLRFGEQNAELTEKTRGMNTLLDEAGRCVHNIVSDLRPTALEMGIVPAVGWLCNEFSARNECACVLHTDETHMDLDETRSVAIFRVVQELLTNAARYANATSVEINMARNADALRIEVRDNGKGFNPDSSAKTRSFGLIGIRERAIALGGDFNLASAPNRGTVATITIPMKTNGDST